MNTILQDLRYTYDPVGNIDALADRADAALFFRGTVETGDAAYRYDALYRLIEATGREHPALGDGAPNAEDIGLSAVPALDDASKLHRYSESYTYDEVGNLLVRAHRAILAPGLKRGWTRRYAYGPPGAAPVSNRLQATSAPGDPDAGPFSERYTHDAHGNMTSMPHLARIDWTHRDEMKRVDLGGGGEAFYVYDADGRRTRKVVERSAGLTEETIDVGGFEVFRRRLGGTLEDERTTVHVMDGARRVALVETATVGGGLPIATKVPRVRYSIDNHLSSSVVELGEVGEIISYEEYDPWGGTTFHSAAKGSTAKRYRYSGKEKDNETGLYYFGARYYPPWLGRWTSADPAGLVDGPNAYVFVRNNPVRLSDPTGRAAAATSTCDPTIASCASGEPAEANATMPPPPSPNGSQAPPPEPPLHVLDVDTMPSVRETSTSDRVALAIQRFVPQIPIIGLLAFPEPIPESPAWAEKRSAQAIGNFGANVLLSLLASIEPPATSVVADVTTLTPGEVPTGPPLANVAGSEEVFTSRGQGDVPFDPVKLARIQANLEREGVTFVTGEEGGRLAKMFGGEAAYIPEVGQPGIIALGPNPSRAAVIEELLHLGQHRAAKWGDMTGKVVGLEIQAQDKLLKIGQRLEWTEAELEQIARAKLQWQKGGP